MELDRFLLLIGCGVEMAGNEKSNKGSLRWEMEGGMRAGVPHPMAMECSRVNPAPPVPRAPVRMLRPQRGRTVPRLTLT